jgi:two-component system, OmpR family, KDP operon response regulator KdpE
MTSPTPPRPRIAVIDDEADVLTFLRLALEDSGFDVLASSSPNEVLPELRSFAPDLICLDLLMPERMGLSLFLEIRRIPALSRVPVVILSGLSGTSRPLDGLDLDEGVVPPAGYIEKPVELGVLLATVRRLVAAQSEAPR